MVVPMKDEEGSLPLLGEEVERLEGLLSARGDTLEIVLVDDGSVDGTAALAETLCANASRGRLVRHEVNQGFGAGLRSGVAATSGDVVVSYDADCAYPAADIIVMLDTLAGGADVASATPFVPGGDHDANALRILLSRGCSWSYRVALRGRARGMQTFTCAFRAYRGDLIRELTWEANGFLAAAEIISRLLLAGARVAEVPSTLRDRVAGESKMRVVRTTIAHLRLISRLVLTRGTLGTLGAVA